MNLKKLCIISLIMMAAGYLLTAQTNNLTVRVTGLFEQSDSHIEVEMTMGDYLSVSPEDIDGNNTIWNRDIAQFQYQANTVVSFLMSVPGPPPPGTSYAYNQFSHLEGDVITAGIDLPDLVMDRDLDITAVYTYTVHLAVTPSPTPPEPLIGDVNQDERVDIIDALMIAQYFVGLSPPGFDPAAADVNIDGKVDIIDALVTARYYVCEIDCSLPLGETTPRVTNPFARGNWYVNPVWSTKAGEMGGEAISGSSTAIWLDSIGTITNGMGVRGHLDEAVSREADVIMFILYDLPNRDCARDNYIFPATGEMARYKNEYIDPLAAIFSDPAYRGLRIVCVVEPGALPNLITNLDLPACQEAAGDDGYVEGIQYALNRLGELSNVYSYLDIAHSGWLGWDTNFEPMADLLAQVAHGTTRGFAGVSGFISNVALYTPLEEFYLPDPGLLINGIPVKNSDFYEWNPRFDELDFVQDMRTALVNRGFAPTIGMLIDTSRNGWGGSSYGRTRPTGVSSSNDLNTYVNESRIDRRYHRGNWCNQAGGIGERPAANPHPGIAAYVWAYPPGESDGISYPGFQEPYDPRKTFDIMCDPNGRSLYNSEYGTGSLDAPSRGRWNQLQFEILLENAYPPL